MNRTIVQVKRPSRGFALAAVLWLIAGLSIVVAMVGDAAVSAKQRVAQLRERTDFLQDSISARAQVLYRLSVSRPTTAGWTDGVTTIWGDETPYQPSPSSLLQLQDMGGLLNLNAVQRDLMANFLSGCGVATDKIDALTDALEDYTDSDNLSRINGAERDTYTWAGKPEPRNSPLLAVAEVWSVWGWDAHRQILEANRCIDHLAALPPSGVGTSRINLATAPPRVLQAAGLSADAIEDITRARGDLEAVAQRVAQQNPSGGVFSGAPFALKTVRVRHRHPGGPWQLEYTLTLDASSTDRPWFITQVHVSSGIKREHPFAKIPGIPWPQEPPAVTTSDVANLLKL